MAEIWVLGASGRSGRMIAAQLVARGHSPVLLGRDPARLAAVADRIAAEHGNRPRTRVMASLQTLLADLESSRSTVVVNTIGPFTRTAVPIAAACPPGTHYLDLANELPAVTGLLALHQQAVNGGRAIVPGAGFGVVATESVVRALCEDRPTPQRVRVDAVPAVDIEAGPVGEALAATILDGFPAGGRRYEDGHLVDAPLGTGQERLVLPDGSIVTTAAIPFGDLEAAHRASGAPSVVSASSEAPTGRAMPYLLPVVARLLSWDSLRAFAIRRVAGIKLRPRARSRELSYAHARVEWTEGTTREGWLRTGEASAFTAAAAAEVAVRLARGEGRAGAHTPGELFGPQLAVDLGGELTVSEVLS